MPGIAKSYDSPPYDLLQLRYLRVIVAVGSLTAAAEQLRVSQPTLSKAMRDLEARVGTALFLRGPRGVIATAAGQRLARAADDVLALLHLADEELRDLEGAPAGHFVVGCYHSMGTIFLPELMRDLQTRAPAIALSLWEGTSARVFEAVIERSVDFGIGTTSSAPAKPHPDLVMVPLFRDVMGVMRGRRRLPHSTKTAPLFHVPRVNLSQRVIEALATRGELPERVVACGDLELVKRFVQRGVGHGVLPWRVAVDGEPKLELLDPALPFEVDVGCIFYRADRPRTRGALLLRDELVRRGRALDGVALPCGVARVGKK